MSDFEQLRECNRVAHARCYALRASTWAAYLYRLELMLGEVGKRLHEAHA